MKMRFDGKRRRFYNFLTVFKANFMKNDLYEFHKNRQFDHWWFRGRAKVVESFMDHHVRGRDLRILDIGSGYGSMIPILRKWGEVDVLEPHADSHETLRDLGAQTIHGLESFPSQCPDSQYDLVTLFDVLEHIREDAQALRALSDKTLCGGGKLVLTVPAYPWLWTKRDEQNLHFRRYTRKSLKTALERAGFRKIRVSYFMTILFPLALIQRLLARWFGGSGDEGENPRRGMNYLFSRIFGAERRLIRRVNLPFGLSLIAFAEK